MKTLVVLILCLAPVVLAEDFKTIDGKEYKNAKVRRVEPDGIVLKSSSGISKIYFTELPKEVQEQFKYDATKATAYSTEQAINQQQLQQQQDELRRKLTEEKNKYWADRERGTVQQNTRPLQVPFLTAVSHDTGSFVTESGSGARSIGNVTYINKSQTTTGIIAVNVKLRTVGAPLREPYEVQCFFLAKDESQSRYIYDTIKFHSRAQFDEINVFARDLFSGTKTTDISVSKYPISGMTSGGDYYSGTLSNTVLSTTTKPGSQIEGWIVRVLSRGQVLRFEASLSDLKAFAERESPLLDKAAGRISFRE